MILTPDQFDDPNPTDAIILEYLKDRKGNAYTAGKITADLIEAGTAPFAGKLPYNVLPVIESALEDLEEKELVEVKDVPAAIGDTQRFYRYREPDSSPRP